MGIADNTPQKGYCIYAHLNKINGKVYIGISKDVKKRWRNKEKAYKGCTLIGRAFKKYGWDNFAHIVMWDGLTKEEACRLKKANIFMYKFANMSYNIADGGEGTCGVVRSEKHKQVLRKRMTGRYISPETRAKISKTHRELHITGKKVYAFDPKTKELIREYPAVKEAAREVKINSNNISRAANGKRPSAGGYIWSYLPTIDTHNLYYNGIGKANCEVYCYDIHGKFIKKYNNSKEAALDINCSVRGINAVCSGEKVSYYHYIWRHNLCEIEPAVLKKIRFKRHEINRSRKF